MQQFTIITKDGSKWLRPINVPYPNADDYEDGNEPHPEFARADAVIYEERTRPVPYIGNRPDETVVDESEVKEVRQYRKIGAGLDWTTCPSEQVEKAATDRPSFELRTAYTDAESHDMHITDTMETEEQLAYKSLEEIHKHTTLCTNDDEENLFVVGFIYGLRQGKSHDRHISDDYWHKRCEAAERYISESPCDPDITSEQLSAYNAWQKLVKQK